MKQITHTFLEGESPTLNQLFVRDYYNQIFFFKIKVAFGRNPFSVISPFSKCMKLFNVFYEMLCFQL